MTPRALALLCPGGQGADTIVEYSLPSPSGGPSLVRRGTSAADGRHSPAPDDAPPLRVHKSSSMLSVLSVDGRQYSASTGAVGGLASVVSRSASSHSLPIAVYGASQQQQQQQQQQRQHSTSKMMSYIATFAVSPFVGEGAVPPPPPPPESSPADQSGEARRGSVDLGDDGDAADPTERSDDGAAAVAVAPSRLSDALQPHGRASSVH